MQAFARTSHPLSLMFVLNLRLCRYTLTVGQGLVWRGGSIVGPGNVTVAGVSKIMGDVAQITLR